MPSDKRLRQREAREARLAAEAKQKKQRQRIRNGIIVVVAAAAIVGIAFAVSGGGGGGGKPKDSKQAQADAVAVAAGCPASTQTTVNTQHYASAPPMTVDSTKTYTATVKTTAGTFDVALDAKSAPTTVNNFVFLAGKGYFHCVIFHRVIPGFMDQTGDPTGTGSGGPGYTIPAENPPKAANGAQQYPLGSVAMATSSQGVSGSQFFIVTGPQGESLANTYPLFGQVTSGMNVVQKINQEGNGSPSANGSPPDVTQRILSVTVNQS